MMKLLRFIIVSYWFKIGAYSRTANPKVLLRTDKLDSRFRDWALDVNTHILIDGDNVRGKTAFKATKESLFHDVKKWAVYVGLADRVCLMYDHGDEHEAFRFDGLSICFSGPERSADDVIARDVMWLQRRFNCSVVVVTADFGLKSRCFQGAKIVGNELAIVDSTLFVEMLSTIMYRPPESTDLKADDEQEGQDDSTPTVPLSDINEAFVPFDPAKMSMLRRELGVRNQIKNIEKYVRGGGGKKKVSKLKKRQKQLEDRLQRVIATECGLTLSPSADGAQRLTPANQQVGYEALIKMMRTGSSRGREETWERVLLAERFRTALLAREGAVTTTAESSQDSDLATADSAFATYVREINCNYSRTNLTAELHRRPTERLPHAVESGAVEGGAVEGGAVEGGAVTDGGQTIVAAEVAAALVVGAVFLIQPVASPDAVSGTDTAPSQLSPLHQQLLRQQRREREQLVAFQVAPKGPSARAVVIAATAIAGPRMSNGVPFEVTTGGCRVYEVDVLGDEAVEGEGEGEGEGVNEHGVSAIAAGSAGAGTSAGTGAAAGTGAGFGAAAAAAGGGFGAAAAAAAAGGFGAAAAGFGAAAAGGFAGGFAAAAAGGSAAASSSTSGICSSSDSGICTGTGTGSSISGNGSSSISSSADSETDSSSNNNNSNNNNNNSSSSSSSTIADSDATVALRIVAVSDTHGMESILSGSVPEGDVLIHAGDFAPDKGKSQRRMKQLDEWLALHPHPVKIVIRGNHDPTQASFPLSKVGVWVCGHVDLFDGSTALCHPLAGLTARF